jgi:hypothetical protein
MTQVRIFVLIITYPQGCSNHPPGLRAQFLDYTPSGLWITNVNNTFVGNVAVGHSYGIWIRVDFVFSEPAFPCVGCDCALPRQELPTLNGTGLVMIDNVAHSNTLSALWIKENWVPGHHTYSLEDDIHQYIKGLVAYKNNIAFEIYGIGSVHFENLIGADNTMAVTIDWERTYSTNWTSILLVGETDNHGI